MGCKGPLDRACTLMIGYLKHFRYWSRDARSWSPLEELVNVISASRRTDIPAFYAEWFMSRIRCGRAVVAAPFNRGMFDVSLAPEDVAAIVFWTKKRFSAPGAPL